MGVKVKILGENKEKVDEGLGALLDPTLLASIAVGLGVGIPFLQSMLGSSDRKAIENMSAQQAAAYVDNVVYGSGAKAKAARKERDAAQRRREKELEKLKAARDAKKAQQAPEQEDMPKGIEMQPGIEPSSSGKIPEPRDIKKYIDVMALARSTKSDNERNIANNILRKMEKEFPGIQDHPEVQSAEKLNELFKRYL